MDKTGPDDLLDAIRTQGEARVHTIETEARLQAEEIVAAAHAEAQRVHERARERVIASAKRERARLLQDAHLDAVKLMGDAQEELITQAQQKVREQLSQVRMTNEYTALLRGLVQEALQELDKSLRAEETAVIEIDARDREVVDQILQEMGRKLHIEESLTTAGGMNVHSPDKRVSVYNTLESRLEHALPHLHSKLLNILAENEDDASNA